MKHCFCQNIFSNINRPQLKFLATLASACLGSSQLFLASWLYSNLTKPLVWAKCIAGYGQGSIVYFAKISINVFGISFVLQCWSFTSKEGLYIIIFSLESCFASLFQVWYNVFNHVCFWYVPESALIKSRHRYQCPLFQMLQLS